MARLSLTTAMQCYEGPSVAAAGRAAEILDTLARDLKKTPWRSVAHRFSNLTADGYPLELSFAQDDTSVRWTAEVASAEVHPALRLERALIWLKQLGAADLDPADDPLLNAVHLVQQDTALRFGTWISGRHDRQGDRFKLYFEVPETAAQAMTRELLGERHLRAQGLGVLRMVGWSPAGEEPELYFRAVSVEPWQIESLLARNCGSERASELLDLVATVADRPVTRQMPWRRVGISLRPGSDEIAIFAVARTLLGSDANIRRHLVNLMENRSCHLPNYAAVSRPVSQRTARPTRHGMIVFGASAKATTLGVGLRPPEAADISQPVN